MLLLNALDLLVRPQGYCKLQRNPVGFVKLFDKLELILLTYLVYVGHFRNCYKLWHNQAGFEGLLISLNRFL